MPAESCGTKRWLAYNVGKFVLALPVMQEFTDAEAEQLARQALAASGIPHPDAFTVREVTNWAWLAYECWVLNP